MAGRCEQVAVTVILDGEDVEKLERAAEGLGRTLEKLAAEMLADGLERRLKQLLRLKKSLQPMIDAMRKSKEEGRSAIMAAGRAGFVAQ